VIVVVAVIQDDTYS